MALGGEKQIMLCGGIALEKQIYVATRAERIQNLKHWILTLNAEGPQQPLNQRLDFAQATRVCKRLHDEHLARTEEEYRIHSSQSTSKTLKMTTNPRATKNTTTRLTLKQVGGSTKGCGETASSSSSKCDQTHWKTSNWNSQRSSSPDDW